MTFLFTDIEGSTRLLHELGADRYAELLAEHHRAMRTAIAEFGGVEVDTEGDAFFVAFPRAADALSAAAKAQKTLPVRVRMGIHTGDPLLGSTGYVGIDVHQAARIAAAAHGGQVVVSERTRSLVDGTAALRDLGLHRLKDLTEPQKLFQLGDTDFPPLRTLYATNLPVQPTPIVGRERELAEVLELLRSSRRLTLTGAGGTGKTRLAMQAAAEVVDDFPDGVWFASLAAVDDPELLESSIRQAVGAREDLASFLRGKALLLLLDNLEQLLPDVARFIAEIDAKVLATSRERLNVAGEQEYEVPTLSTGDAVAMFIQRARLLQPSFEPDEYVTAIAQRLDGLPLALELAAARVKVLTTEQIVARLERALELLTAGSRDLPDRQRTLRATIDWSHDLLGADEQRLFADLAVFPGSFSLEAAEAVCAAQLDLLQSLIDKSLLRHTGDGRFFMLATIREFALERLAASERRERINTRHAEHFLALAVELQPLLAGSEDAAVMEQLDREGDNLRAAVRLFIEAGEADSALELVNAIQRYWRVYGHLAEGRRLTEEVLTLRGSTPYWRARGLRAKANLAGFQGDGEAARAAAEEALAIFAAEGDTAGSIDCLNALAGAMVRRDDLPAARACLEEGARLARTLDDPFRLSAAVGNLGGIAMYERDFGDAQRFFEEAVEIARALGKHEMVANLLSNAAICASKVGDQERAAGFARESLDLHAQIRDAPGTVCALIAVEAILLARQEWESLAVVSAGITTLADAMELDLEPLEAELHERAVKLASASLSLGAYTAATARGRELGHDELLAAAARALEGLTVA